MHKMPISIESCYYVSSDHREEGYRHLKAHGYDGVDYSDLCDTENPLFSLSAEAFDRRLKEEGELVKSLGLSVFQVHGPWRYPPRDATPEDRAERFEKMARVLHGTRMLGSPYMVIHPIMPRGTNDDGNGELLFEENLRFFEPLLKIAAQEQVTVCFENMPMRHYPLSPVQKVLELVKAMDHPCAKICLDTGHSAVLEHSPADEVRLLGNEWLKTLHVHDNRCSIDLHLPPFTGVIDWCDFMKSLQEISFAGAVSLETGFGKNSRHPAVTERMQCALADVARQIAGREDEIGE